jgi:hypothetical protein
MGNRCAASVLQYKNVTLLSADALSFSVRNVDQTVRQAPFIQCNFVTSSQGGKRKLKWEVSPTDMTVVSADETTNIARFLIASGEGFKEQHREHKEQVVTFSSASDLARFVSALRTLSAAKPPANSRASRKVATHALLPSTFVSCCLFASLNFVARLLILRPAPLRPLMCLQMDMESLMMRAALCDDKSAENRSSNDMKIVRFRYCLASITNCSQRCLICFN